MFPLNRTWNWNTFTSFIVVLTIFKLIIFTNQCNSMKRAERIKWREKVREMFFHAYNNYIDHAFPADELMPLTCKGRYRGSSPSKGEIDDVLGNFSLTLIDSLDTLFILNETAEFESAVRKVISHVTFDRDIDVSVFETNIRVVGGLIGGHVSAVALQSKDKSRMSWYRGELLEMAEDIGLRLLPSFNTSTGVPYPRVNLRWGLARSAKSGNVRPEDTTCTACAGSMILEFAALSRLTGNPVFEQKASRAMTYLWENRNRKSDLVGTVINIHNGQWIRHDSGVGAGIDSYYEYLFKAYVLLGEEEYLHRFNKHYSAINRYVSTATNSPIPFLLDVHMHKPQQRVRNYMDALHAFWPGLQVMMGDVKPAIALHEVLYQVVQRHNFIPEAFTTDLGVHWGQHPLRPEFVESTYLLYRATGDDHYLQVGKQIVENLNKYARVRCGFAAIEDVRTLTHYDQMDSFFLAETMKYLYLLFADPATDLPIDLSDYVMTTEAHLLPLSLTRKDVATTRTSSTRNRQQHCINHYHRATVALPRHTPGNPDTDPFQVRKSARAEFTESVRLPLHDLISRLHPYQNSQSRGQWVGATSYNLPGADNLPGDRNPWGKWKRRPILRASDLIVSSSVHQYLLKKMGIEIIPMYGGSIKLVHNQEFAESESMVQDGKHFMDDMTKLLSTPVNKDDRRYVIFSTGSSHVVLYGSPAHFDLFPAVGEPELQAGIQAAQPIDACSSLRNVARLHGKIALVRRGGGCGFLEKALFLEGAGAVGVIVMDNVPGSSFEVDGSLIMSSLGPADLKVEIPVIFLYSKEVDRLTNAMREPGVRLVVRLTKTVDNKQAKNKVPIDNWDHLSNIKLAQDSRPLPEKSPIDRHLRVVMEMWFSSRVDFQRRAGVKSSLPQLVSLSRGSENQPFEEPDHSGSSGIQSLGWSLIFFPSVDLRGLYGAMVGVEKSKLFYRGLVNYLDVNTNMDGASWRSEFVEVLWQLLSVLPQASTSTKAQTLSNSANLAHLDSILTHVAYNLVSNRLSMELEEPRDVSVMALILRARSHSNVDISDHPSIPGS